MIWHRSLERHIALCLICVVSLPIGAVASPSGQTHLPESVFAQQVDIRQTQATQEKGANPTALKSSDSSLSSQQADQQGVPQATEPTSKPNTPLGTAAAPDTHVDGIAASTPSGAAIAPAKQRRVRKFAIRTVLIVGAVVAVGVVAAASLGSPSRP